MTERLAPGLVLWPVRDEVCYVSGVVGGGDGDGGTVVVWVLRLVCGGDDCADVEK